MILFLFAVVGNLLYVDKELISLLSSVENSKLSTSATKEQLMRIALRVEDNENKIKLQGDTIGNLPRVVLKALEDYPRKTG